MKKNVLIYATCQGQAIAEILNSSPQYEAVFNASYIIRNFVFISRKENIIDNAEYRHIFQNADVFIYQPIDNIFGKNATDYLIPFLKPDCIKISMPYVTNISLWPFIIAQNGDLNDDWRIDDKGVPKIRHIDPVDALIESGKNKEEILSLYDKNKIDWSYNARHFIIMNYLRAKEKGLDIQVVDYIEQNLQHKRMFVFYSHPSADLFVYMTNRILDILGLPHVENNYEDNAFFPSVSVLGHTTSAVRHYGLTFVSKEEQHNADLFYRKTLIIYLNGKTC